ncbi:MAG: hypothetical protein M1820_010631 [Bogoriella megaspora]|nr:MAG: hypothetical protein M1820_010631 [Bogoriella megaspora]
MSRIVLPPSQPAPPPPGLPLPPPSLFSATSESRPHQSIYNTLHSSQSVSKPRQILPPNLKRRLSPPPRREKRKSYTRADKLRCLAYLDSHLVCDVWRDPHHIHPDREIWRSPTAEDAADKFGFKRRTVNTWIRDRWRIVAGDGRHGWVGKPANGRHKVSGECWGKVNGKDDEEGMQEKGNGKDKVIEVRGEGGQLLSVRVEMDVEGKIKDVGVGTRGTEGKNGVEGALVKYYEDESKSEGIIYESKI